ncbi:MAG: signal peptidase II [Candidatus Pelagibacter sp. TMED118]|nr:MAG: signal peptidase II [Candidatus Pelagibacter sp. TMED118]
MASSTWHDKIKLLKIYFIFFFIFPYFFLDRVSKIYILNIANNEELNIYINDFLNIILIWNTGIGFGLLSFKDNTVYNSITFLILLINFVLIYIALKSDNLKRILFIIILGGSSGNLFDRFYYSAVPDFIDINYNGFHWFVFNVADIFITIGIICLIFIEILAYNKKSDQ